jgi:hypothetical protein
MVQSLRSVKVAQDDLKSEQPLQLPRRSAGPASVILLHRHSQKMSASAWPKGEHKTHATPAEVEEDDIRVKHLTHHHHDTGGPPTDANLHHGTRNGNVPKEFSTHPNISSLQPARHTIDKNPVIHAENMRYQQRPVMELSTKDLSTLTKHTALSSQTIARRHGRSSACSRQLSRSRHTSSPSVAGASHKHTTGQ